VPILHHIVLWQCLVLVNQNLDVLIQKMIRGNVLQAAASKNSVKNAKLTVKEGVNKAVIFSVVEHLKTGL